MMEQVLEDMAAATELRAIILRYFNPIGSDPDLESGIYAKEPSHVLGQLVMAARGQKDAFTITGTDNPTRDGTGIRDYIHVWDLARAHVRAVERFDEVIAAAGEPSVVINIGTGSGVTVRELVVAFEKVFGREVPIREAPSRPGDVPGAFANVDRAHELLGWQPRALARGGDRLGAGLGREAPGDPGLRVNPFIGALLAPLLAVPAPAAGGFGRARRGSQARTSGRAQTALLDQRHGSVTRSRWPAR